MQLLPALVLALLLLLSSSTWCGLPWGTGVSLESLLTNMRCKCIRSTAHVINLGLILTIDVTPPGIHCRRKEVILTLKKNKRVCVTPEAPWIQLLIHKLMQRYVIPGGWKTPGIPDTLVGPSLLPDPPGFLSFLPQNLQEQHQKSVATTTAGSTVLPAPLENPHPIPPTGQIPGIHRYEFLVGQQ
uniref:Chemokine interleukin-8-like domain-containing protein n=1 Tax=Taeniopygia guttata TaxID=59729 RepID=A0A674HKE6_TAEGU